MNNPQLPEAFQSVVNLGSLKGFFPLSKGGRWTNIIFLFLLWGGAVIGVLYGIYQAITWQRYGPVMVEDQLRTPLIAAFVLFLLGLLALWGLFVNWKKAAALYEHGLAYTSRKGLEMWRWEEVVLFYAAITRHYTNGVYTGTTHVYTLIDRQARRLVLNDSLQHIEDLGKAVEAGTFPSLYAGASGLYNSGQPVAFGPVTISKSGIQFKNKVYPWTDVKEVSIRRGILQVSKKDGGWFSGASAAVAGIPNLRVLLSIIDQVVGIKTA